MTGSDEIVASKFANAFFPDAEMSTRARRAFIFGGDNAVDWLRGRMGGLWVGGAVTLTREALIFSPNAMNVAAHEGNVYWAIPLASIGNVSDRFGWLTRIVDVETEDGETVSFRCFGARAFADQVRRTAAESRNSA